MASKFQNRLVGTIILVAVGVIALPGLLDGDKKHYKEEFAAIPLVPKPDDQQDTDMVPPVTQSLPAQPPQGAGAAVRGDRSPPAEDNDTTLSQSDSQPSATPGKHDERAREPEAKPVEQVKPKAKAPESSKVKPVEPLKPKPVEQVKPKPVEQVKPKPVEQVKPKPVEQAKPKPVEQAKPTAVEPAKPKPVEQAKPTAVEPAKPKPAEQPPASEQSAPVGQAYVVQLGALKNATRASEIVAQLRLSGYRAFTVPATPIQGQITRIYVGPDASKAKMQAAVGALQGISGLSGVVKPYSVR